MKFGTNNIGSPFPRRLYSALLLACLVFTSCGGGADQCRHAAGVDDGGPGACDVGRNIKACNDQSGAGCICVTDTQSCGACGAGDGTACADRCDSDEYALSCGGPPLSNASFTYAHPPVACHGGGGTPAGNTYYCSPCL